MEPLCEEKNDEVRCRVHPRYIWLLMVKPVLVLLLLMFVLNFANAYQYLQNLFPVQFAFEMLVLNILLAVLILVPSYIWCWLEYRSFVYTIKKDEIAIRKGIILKRHNSIPYNKIRNVQRLQSFLERIFGLCTISIETADVSFSFPDSSIPGMLNSKELPEIILGRMHASEDAGTNLGETMHQILLQLKELNKRDQRHENKQNLKQDLGVPKPWRG